MRFISEEDRSCANAARIQSELDRLGDRLVPPVRLPLNFRFTFSFDLQDMLSPWANYCKSEGVSVMIGPLFMTANIDNWWGRRGEERRDRAQDED